MSDTKIKSLPVKCAREEVAVRPVLNLVSVAQDQLARQSG